MSMMLRTEAGDSPCTTAKRPREAKTFSAFSLKLVAACARGSSPGNCGKSFVEMSMSSEGSAFPATSWSKSMKGEAGTQRPPLPQRADHQTARSGGGTVETQNPKNEKQHTHTYIYNLQTCTK
jgi:hypothetical protein